jgi:D-alanine-D-alanine ligase
VEWRQFMSAPKKKQVLVIYGGRSTEHEISCRSAAFVIRNLDPKKYDVYTLAIDKSGRWLPQDTKALLASTREALSIDTTLRNQPALPSGSGPGESLLLTASGQGARERLNKEELVIFPVLHGTFGEDGTLQGFFEMSEVAYVGPDHMGSAVGMDKVMSKKLAQAAGVPVVPWLDTRKQFWDKHRREIGDAAVKELGFPMFVKPAKLGSSVGITKVESKEALEKACDVALSFDDKVLIEKGMAVREIECAVLGDYDPIVSVPGEVIPHAEFYTYDAKYNDAAGASIEVPARLTTEQAKEAQELSKKIFMALELYGMARIDLFLEEKTNKFYLNEVNTIPGFTSISQYPLLWKASGIDGPELLDRLVELAEKRRLEKAALRRTR